MILTIVATVSERHAPLSHAKDTTNSKIKETVQPSNKMSKKYFYGIRNNVSISVFKNRVCQLCLSVPREKKSSLQAWLRQYQSYSSNWYINGKVFEFSIMKNIFFFTLACYVCESSSFVSRKKELCIMYHVHYVSFVWARLLDLWVHTFVLCRVKIVVRCIQCFKYSGTLVLCCW